MGKRKTEQKVEMGKGEIESVKGMKKVGKGT